MNKIQNFLKKVDLVKSSIVLAVGADVLYVINIVWCIIEFFKLDTTNFEGQYEKERGLANYIIGHFTNPILFKICIVILLVSVGLIFVAYVRKKEGVTQVIMVGAATTIVISGMVLGVLNIDKLISLRISLFGQLLQFVSWGNIIFWLIVCFVLLVLEKMSRKTTLILLASGIWMAMGAILLIFSTCGLLIWGVLKLCNILFSGSSVRIMEEKDEYGNVIRRWREEL